MKPQLPLAAGLLLLAGCATVAPPPGRTVAILPAPFAEVWPAIVSVVALQHPVQAVERESGLLTTAPAAVRLGPGRPGIPALARLPVVLLGVWSELECSLAVQVVALPGGETEITVRAHLRAYENNITTEWYRVESTGALEDEILTALERELSNRRAQSSALGGPPR